MMADTERIESELIQNYVKEASSLTGSSPAELIVDATSNPNLFAFSEILSVPSVAEAIPYDVLKPVIEFTSVRELEDFLIDECIYMGIVKGKLNPLQGCFEVQYAAARDSKPGQLKNIINNLSGWLSTSDKLLLTVQENIKLAETMSELDMKQGKEYEDTVNETKTEGKQTRSKRKRKQAP